MAASKYWNVALLLGALGCGSDAGLQDEDAGEGVADGGSSDTPDARIADVDAGSDTVDASSGDALSCNGSPDYCDRPYNDVSVVCTHNAMANAQDHPVLIPTPNQTPSFIPQLDAGVRCMMLDTYDFAGEPHLCHANCALGATPWVPMLQDVKTWMESHPGEVLTFILEPDIAVEAVQEALEDASIWPLVYHHGAPPGTPWPTLREMVELDQRLVIFTTAGDANQDWHLNWKTYGFETQYNDDTFSCQDSRGDPAAYDNQVYILNHYTLCTLGGCASNGEVNNAYDFLLPRAIDCWSYHETWNPFEQIPTFVNLDHYDVPATDGQGADAFEVVEALNAMWQL